jgi:RNA polymerase sigma factor (sigma-70 family)
LLSDEELLRLSRRDPDGFVAFYERHGEPLFRFLLRETSNPVVAADLAAETFAQALRSLSRFRGDDPGSAQAWLYRIARRLLGRQRTRGRLEARARQQLGMPTSYEDVFREVDERASVPTDGKLAAGLDELPHDQREAIELRVIGDLSYREIAARLACTPAAARTRVSRGLRLLRDHLQQEAT